MVHPQNHQVIIDHSMTLRMGKELGMPQRTSKGKEYTVSMIPKAVGV